MKHNYCVACGHKFGLHQHHLLPKSLGGGENDEVTVCEKHHSLVHRLDVGWFTLQRLGREKAEESNKEARRKKADMKSLLKQKAFCDLSSDVFCAVIIEPRASMCFKFIVKHYMSKNCTDTFFIDYMMGTLPYKGYNNYSNILGANKLWLDLILHDLITDKVSRKNALAEIKKIQNGRDKMNKRDKEQFVVGIPKPLSDLKYTIDFCTERNRMAYQFGCVTGG